ncbi:hypothetical protein TNCV_3562871 [Trichonephila clavipes]|nr:hypothetical protein TNCV_3562871 [Trichonephila clavipes]
MDFAPLPSIAQVHQRSNDINNYFCQLIHNQNIQITENSPQDQACRIRNAIFFTTPQLRTPNQFRKRNPRTNIRNVIFITTPQVRTPNQLRKRNPRTNIRKAYFITTPQTPNIKSNLSPKLRPKFEGPYRVIERFSNVNYRVQHVEQLRKRFNIHVNRMIPFIKRFSYLHINNLDDLQPDETENKGIVPSSRYNLRARAGNSAH